MSITAITNYGIKHESIVIDKKYKFLFCHMYNSNGYSGEAYDVRLFPTNVGWRLRLKVYGIDMISNNISVSYSSGDRILKMDTEVGFQVFGIN